MTSRALHLQTQHRNSEDDDDDLSASTPLRAASPLVIEEDEALTSFFQNEAHGLNIPSYDTTDPILSQNLDDYDSGHYNSSPNSPIYRGSTAQPVKLTPFIALLTVAACISGLLFGYDTGVVSSTLVSLGTDLGGSAISTLDKSLITSSTSLFALFASPLGGWLADAVGRKRVIVVADVLFVAGALVQAWSQSVALMVLGRSIVGVAVGAASLVVPLYISELAPPEYRGRLVVVNSLFITGGQMAAYLLGWRLAAIPHGWRWMVGLGAIPALVQLALLVMLPESPRWLIKAGHVEPARAILDKAYGPGSEGAVYMLVRAIEREIFEEEEVRLRRAQSSALRKRKGKGTDAWYAQRPAGWNELFEIGGNRRALIISCVLQGFQQLCGFNSLMYFSATIFALVGFHSPILASLSVAVTNFIFTLVAMLLIDRLGRRRTLLLTVPFMIVGLALTALCFLYLRIPLGDGGLVAVAVMPANSFWAMLILVSIITYVASYATGLGSVPWQQSELFPLSVRSLGCGIATATNWGSNFLVGLTFLPMMQLLSPSLTFVFYALMCAAGWVVVYRIYPETKGLGLEEVGGLLKDGWGVAESLRRRKGSR